MPITLLIKTITKFSNVIGYHQPNWALIRQCMLSLLQLLIATNS